MSVSKAPNPFGQLLREPCLEKCSPSSPRVLTAFTFAQTLSSKATFSSNQTTNETVKTGVSTARQNSLRAHSRRTADAQQERDTVHLTSCGLLPKSRRPPDRSHVCLSLQNRCPVPVKSPEGEVYVRDEEVGLALGVADELQVEVV